jgi:hypothetical protein
MEHASQSTLASNITSCQALEAELNHLRAQKNQVVEKADQLANSYDNFLRRAVCDQMQAALPRELRDMVYCHVIQQLGPWFVRILKDEFTRNQRIPDRFRFSDEYSESSMNFETLNELAQMWYRRQLFYFYGYSTIEHFLPADLWGSGINPRDHIRTIGTDILVSDMAYRVSCVFPREAIKKSLFSLLALMPGTSFCLEIHIPFAHLAHPCDILMERLEYIFDILKTLENHGLNILVFPRLCSDTVQVSKAVKLLRGPVPSVEEWLHKAQTISGTLRGNTRDVTGVDMSKEDRMWFDLLTTWGRTVS